MSECERSPSPAKDGSFVRFSIRGEISSNEIWNQRRLHGSSVVSSGALDISVSAADFLILTTK